MCTKGLYRDDECRAGIYPPRDRDNHKLKNGIESQKRGWLTIENETQNAPGEEATGAVLAGVVVEVGSKLITVKMDGSGRVLRFRPDDLLPPR